ncbi:MAG: TatD family hydrolase [Bacillota bacterium]
MYIDSHVHLNSDVLYENLDFYVKKAQQQNVSHMIVIGFDGQTNKRAIEIAKNYPNIYATVGYHPTEAKSVTNDDFELLKTYLKQDKVVAIGECGFDFYWDEDHEAEQRYVFRTQIELAKEFDVPLIIHMREATEKTFKLLEAYAPIKGIMHCYSGSAEMAERFLELGLHISLGGPVTFKNAKTPKEVARMVPLDKLLIETDAPYLTPHPYRGKQNDSSYIPLIAKEIARIKSLSVEKIAQATTYNALKLFNIKDDKQ